MRSERGPSPCWPAPPAAFPSRSCPPACSSRSVWRGEGGDRPENQQGIVHAHIHGSLIHKQSEFSSTFRSSSFKNLYFTLPPPPPPPPQPQPPPILPPTVLTLLCVQTTITVRLRTFTQQTQNYLSCCTPDSGPQPSLSQPLPPTTTAILTIVPPHLKYQQNF